MLQFTARILFVVDLEFFKREVNFDVERNTASRRLNIPHLVWSNNALPWGRPQAYFRSLREWIAVLRLKMNHPIFLRTQLVLGSVWIS